MPAGYQTGQPHMGQGLAVQGDFIWEDALAQGPEAKITLGTLGPQAVERILLRGGGGG